MTKYQKRKNNAVVNKKFSNSRQNKRKFAKPNTQVIPHVNQALNGSNKALKLVEKGESAVTYANGAKHTNDKPTGNTSDAYDEMKAQLESGEQTNSKLLTMLQATKDILPRRISFKKASKVDSYDLLKNKLVPLGFLQDTTNKQEKTSKKSNLKTLYTSVTESRQNDSATSPAMEDYPIKPKFFLFPPEKILGFMGWKEVSKIGPGLYNLGNTCFMNAVLQCLTYTAPLVNYLKSRDVTAKNSKTFNILDQMTLHVKKSLETSQAFSPKEFAHNLRSIGKRFRFGRQEDSHELIICMLDGMQNIMLQSYKGKLDPRTAETNPIHQIFGGYLQSQVKSLESKYVSNTYDAFVDLNLGINNSSSVDKALKLFIKPDILDGDNKLKCPMCKKYVTAKKQFTIFQAPNILMVNLKRFDIFGRKINKHVQFDEKLSLKEYMSENAIGRNESEYTLYAVLVHDGSSANSGHYYAFVKASNSIWYLMDDSSVQQVSVQTVLKQKAYILFYMKDKPLQLFKTPLPSAQKADKAPNGHTHNQVDSEDEDESETTAKDKKGEKKSSANLNSSESDDDEDLVADSQESNDSDDVGKVVSEKSLRNGLKVKSSSTSRTNGSVKAQKQQLKQQNSNGDAKDKASLKSPKTNSKQATPGPILLANNKDNKQQDKKQTKAPQLKANKTASSKEIHQGRNPQEELESLFDKVKTQKTENGNKGEETSLLKSISTKIGGKPKTPTDQSDPASDSAKLPSPTTPTTSKAQHASTVPSTQNSTEFDPRLLASDHKSQFGTTVGTWEETGEDTKQMRDSLLKQLTPKQNKKRKRDQWDAEYDKGKTKKIKMKKPSIKQQQSIPTSPTGGSRANPFQNVANRKKPQ